VETADDGTAGRPSDYRRINRNLSFAEGQTSLNVVAVVNGDTIAEPDENFFLNLSNPQGGTIEDDQGQGTIENDDGPLREISINDGPCGEGGPLSVQHCTFLISLDQPAPAGGVAVHVETADGTAVRPSDYLRRVFQVSGNEDTYTVPSGETFLGIAVAVVGDSRAEPEETFFINLSNPVGGTIEDGQGKVTIPNDDGPPPQISIDDVSKLEGSSGGTKNFVFQISLDQAAPVGGVSVDVDTADGTAVRRFDYERNNRTITFAQGKTTRNVIVRVKRDSVTEPDETFFVNLLNPLGVEIADGQGKGTIQNDD
jgi:hypothetical protein